MTHPAQTAVQAVQEERIVFRLLDTIDRLAKILGNSPLAVLARIETHLETVMTQADRLSSSLDALAASIASEMADLAAAIAAAGASNPAIDASIDRVNTLVASLAADDAPAPPAA